MRLFLAIDVPSDIVVQLSALQREVAHPSVKLSEHFHITLSYFGDVSPADMMIIQQQLKKIVCPAFNLKLETKLGAFSNWNRLRTIFVGVQYNKILNQLAIKLQNLFPDLETSRSVFAPHITLGRVKHEIIGMEYANHLQSLIVEPFSWRVNELALYESVLRAEGPTYKRISSVKLN